MKSPFVSEEAIVRWLRRQGVTVVHCNSCHEDDEYKDLPLTLNLPNDREAHVCCGVHTAWYEASTGNPC